MRMTNSETLVKKISAIPVGNRDLDDEIFNVLLGGLYWPENETCFLDYGSRREPKRFTTDEGAAFSLMDRVLGDDWLWSFSRNYKACAETPNYNITMRHQNAATWDGDVNVSAATRALALCAAIVSVAKW